MASKKYSDYRRKKQAWYKKQLVLVIGGLLLLVLLIVGVTLFTTPAMPQQSTPEVSFSSCDPEDLPEIAKNLNLPYNMEGPNGLRAEWTGCYEYVTGKAATAYMNNKDTNGDNQTDLVVIEKVSIPQGHPQLREEAYWVKEVYGSMKAAMYMPSRGLTEEDVIVFGDGLAALVIDTKYQEALGLTYIEHPWFKGEYVQWDPKVNPDGTVDFGCHYVVAVHVMSLNGQLVGKNGIPSAFENLPFIGCVPMLMGEDVE